MDENIYDARDVDGHSFDGVRKHSIDENSRSIYIPALQISGPDIVTSRTL